MSFSKSYRGKNANFLIKLAWSVEIIAVMIGLTISMVMALAANDSASAKDSTSILNTHSSMLVAGLPFLLVAVVELCKIPLTFAFMSVKSILWKGLFLFFVSFLCLITFETMLNGFERNFSSLNYEIDKRQNNIENLESEIALLNTRKERIQTFTSEDLNNETSTIQQSIESNYKTQLGSINASVAKKLSGIDYSYRETLDSEVGALIERRDGYYQDWNSERQEVEGKFSALLLDNLSDSRTEKQRLLGELAVLKEEMAGKLAKANFFTRGGIESRYRKMIAEKNKQIDQITTGYLGGDAIEKQASMESQLKQQIAFLNNKYEGRIAEINQRIADKKQEIADKDQANARLRSNIITGTSQSRNNLLSDRQQRESELKEYTGEKESELTIIASKINGVEDQIFRLKNEQRSTQAGINHLMNQNQVYRLAMYAFGTDSPSEVDKQMVGIVAFIWFGSLALIASVTGVILSLAGFYMKREIMAEELLQERKEEQELRVQVQDMVEKTAHQLGAARNEAAPNQTS
ncbi:hypothetical protein EOPP23_02390 [Endozoicomonas sp. OPT23]|uniref:hypothetical protein n=1 Tax=Endozoicomonas sp. OPT23 TaxID=2072845 RepID=UPI00129BDFCA|nr:hypothetical protein [Endozoicomonas sp. OPT23]MRI31844.1 hypothetical protein [Endozoicomonas sp. OPT23]